MVFRLRRPCASDPPTPPTPTSLTCTAGARREPCALLPHPFYLHHAMRHDHLVLHARARWRVAFVLFVLAAALSVWLMSASTKPAPFYCGNAPVEVDSIVVERRQRLVSQRRAHLFPAVHLQAQQRRSLRQPQRCDRPHQRAEGQQAHCAPVLERLIIVGISTPQQVCFAGGLRITGRHIS